MPRWTAPIWQDNEPNAQARLVVAKAVTERLTDVATQTDTPERVLALIGELHHALDGGTT